MVAKCCEQTNENNSFAHANLVGNRTILRNSWGGVKKLTYHNCFLPPEVQQFWYYRTLFIFVLLSPMIIWVLRKRRLGIGLVVLTWTFAFIGMPGQHQYAMWIDQAAFMTGIYLGLHKVRVKLRVDWIICATVFCMIIATALGCLHQRMLYNRAMYLVITFGCLSLWILSPRIVCLMEPFSTLCSLNVFIFAIHFVVLWNVGDLLNLFGLEYYSVSYMCIQYFLTVGICIGLGLIMKMVAPRMLKILSGGRA